MKATVFTEYGSPDVLQLKEVEKPTLKDDQVLVRVQAASVNWLDWHFLTGKPFLARIMAGGLLKPKKRVLGIDMAGRVEAVGRQVRRFQPGDAVFGGGNGTFAEYVSARQDEIQLKPDNVSFEEAAAALAAAFVALQGLCAAAQIQAGQKVLVNGASGGVGTFAVQIAKAFGAEVTGVCSTGNLDLVRSTGADHVIDYTRQDLALGGECYDLIFDVAASRSFQDCKRVLAPNGIYVTTDFSPRLALAGLWRSVTGGQKLVPIQPKPPSPADRALVAKLLGAGKIKSVIDRCYPLDELPEALRYLARGHARGKIVIAM